MHGHGSRIAALAAATVLLLALGGGAATAVDRPTEPGQLTLINTAVGRVIADKIGNPLYMRTADEPDNPDCTGECADVWPAATGYPTKGRGVTNDTAQTVLNAENSDQPQVIYNTHPLYYYSKDKPHLPRGQHVDGFTLVSPNGSAMVLPLSAGPDPDPDPAVSGTTSSTSRAKPPATPTRTRAAPTPPRTPTRAPTRAATRAPTKAPTRAAPRTPTKAPTKAPTRAATRAATKAPTRAATKAPAAPATRVPTPAARVTPARTAAPAVPRTTTGTSTTPSVGGLTITPSGAARGGADHLTAANPSGSYGAAELSLAIGATAAASAGTVLVVRRFQRRSTGGQH
ncbi:MULTISPECIES: hypothetical protein [unclassified Streptomyces]|uniref:hypothetical protein n=1 Tax=unclassified Streptomyces TaxID=2593676 RepID=UPI0036323BBE